MLSLLHKHVNPSDSGVVVGLVMFYNHTNRSGLEGVFVFNTEGIIMFTAQWIGVPSASMAANS
jgi:hypothetical protein